MKFSFTLAIVSLTVLIGFALAGFALHGAPLASASAQTPTASPTKTADVSVERIKPEDLPDEEESTFPSVLENTTALPGAASLSQLRKAAGTVGPRVYEVKIVQVPKPPIRATPILSTGHAVWLSAEEGAVRPVLVTPHSWLGDADSIWVRPAPITDDHVPRAARKTIADISDTRSASRFEKNAERDGWVRVATSAVDKHRNLTTLIAGEDSNLEAPDQGLPLFDPKSRPTTRVYGFSPAVGSALVETRYLEPDDDLVLSFYLQCTFGAVLGAPIVTERAEVVGLTVFRHPEEADRTLVIPPLALARYVEKAQGLTDASGPNRKTVEEEK